MGGPPGELGGVGRARRGEESLPENRDRLVGLPEGPGGVGRPFLRAVRGQEGLGGPPNGSGGVGGPPGREERPSWRSGRGREDLSEELEG